MEAVLLMRPLILRRNTSEPQDTFYTRQDFTRSELLASLPKEMMAAQEQIPGNAHCNGFFGVDWRYHLRCKMPGNQTFVWVWIDNIWQRHK